jgi:cysteine desulfurase/selenocysteine lyase
MTDWNRIREDFPVLKRTINDKPLVYLDSACMSLKPKQVVEAMNEYYEQYPACGGRSIHRLGEEASNAYSAARGKFAKFINAAHEEEIIWTRNATESLNMVGRCVKLPKGSKIITTSLEHHSGSLPFVERARRDNHPIEIVKAQSNGTFDMEDWKNAIDGNTGIVSVVHSSNVTGTVAPIKEIVEIAHDRGALVMCDDAQYAPHHPLDVQETQSVMYVSRTVKYFLNIYHLQRNLKQVYKTMQVQLERELQQNTFRVLECMKLRNTNGHYSPLY